MALIVLNLAHVNVQPSILRAPGEPLAMAGKPAERSMQMERALDAGEPLSNNLSVVSSCTRAELIADSRIY